MELEYRTLLPWYEIISGRWGKNLGGIYLNRTGQVRDDMQPKKFRKKERNRPGKSR
jgi:hypothetical protein